MPNKLKLYNTLTRKKEPFKPIKPGKVGMYVCGPTVYDYVHIGNLRAYVFADVLRRWLKQSRYKVKEVMNITDVDDKTIKKSREWRVKLGALTKQYEKAFLEDIKKLNIEKPEVLPHATEHIKEIIALVKKLMKKGYAYKAKDGIYFSVSKFEDYGKFARINFSKLKKTERMKKDEYDKKKARDFALWKFWDKEDEDVFWETDIGKGRPGWHIECSAMSMKHLGQPFDIHIGGVDLIFPHHQNEIAQSEAATGKKFVNYWLHNEWLFVDGKKMSKSLGNFYTLQDIEKKGFSPFVLRYLFLNSHHRSQLNFTWKKLESAKNAYQRLKNIISEIKDDKKTNKIYVRRFENAMDNDLDTGEALQTLWELVRYKGAAGKIRTIKEIDKVLGLDLLKKEKLEIPDLIKRLVEVRERARKKKDYKKADDLRNRMKERGWWVDDTKQGAKIKKL